MIANPAVEGKSMGRFSVTFEAVNHVDHNLSDAGHLAPSAVRHLEISGVVDTGACRLVLPESAVIPLGLKETGETSVRFADGRRVQRKVVGDVELSLLGRTGVFSAVIEPGRVDALVGAIVLEELDLVVDYSSQQLRPRDPNTTITEVE